MSISRKVALIGYGYWGKKLFRYLERSRDFNLQSVYAPSFATASPAIVETDLGSRAVVSLDPIWNDPAITEVVIATPVPTHVEIAREALLHGKNVLVEKPLAMTAAECRQLQQLAGRHQLKLMTDYTHTFSAALLHARRLLDEGQIGRIQGVTISMRQLGRFLQCDILTLLGSHALSILDLFVPVEDLEFHVHPVQWTSGLMTGGLLQFRSRGQSPESGVAGHIDITAHGLRDKKVIVYGDTGTLVYDPHGAETLVLARYDRRSGIRESELLLDRKGFSFDEANNLSRVLAAFFLVVRGERPDNLERSVQVTAALEKMGAQCLAR